MARHQTNCTWAIELLEAAAIFVAGIAIAAVAAVGYLRNGGIAILFLGGLPAVFFFAIGFRVSSAALRNRRSAQEPLEDDVRQAAQAQEPLLQGGESDAESGSKPRRIG